MTQVNIVFLFAYGTLMRGEPGWELMKDAVYVATVSKHGLRRVQFMDYPSAVEGDVTDSVVGEIWAVPVKDLPLLDEYEGENYRRVLLDDSNLYAYLLKSDESEKFAIT